MRSLQHGRRDFKRYLFSKWVAVLLAVFAVYMVTVVWGMYGRYQETKAELAASATKLEDMQTKKQNLETKVSELSTPSGKEMVLRQKFLVAKDGEQVIVFVPAENASTSDEAQATSQSLWQKFLSIF